MIIFFRYYDTQGRLCTIVGEQESNFISLPHRATIELQRGGKILTDILSPDAEWELLDYEARMLETDKEPVSEEDLAWGQKIAQETETKMRENREKLAKNPPKIEEIDEKEREKPFFDSIHDFSSRYLAANPAKWIIANECTIKFDGIGYSIRHDDGRLLARGKDARFALAMVLGTKLEL